jgi:hypothetical protein
MCLALTLLTARTVYAALNWQGDFFEFSYDVECNGIVYNGSGWDEFFRPDTCDVTNCSYSSEAEMITSDLWGLVDMKARALGTGTSSSPPYGLLVKGYAETNLNGSFNPLIHGVLLDTPVRGIAVTSLASRRFSVDAEGEYVLGASIGGVIDFNVFGSRDDSYFSSFDLSGKVELEKFLVNEFGTATSLGVVATFSLDDKNRTIREEVVLVPEIDGEEVVYQLLVVLQLTTEQQNLVFPSTITSGPDPFVGPFKVGSSANPIELRGFLQKSGAMPWVPLLLLDGQL